MEKAQYPILKSHFESNGYKVKAEINDIDVTALKDDLLILIEMKTSLNVPLIAQGIRRRPLGDSVYLSIPKPSDKVLKSERFKDKCLILKELELGLILVDLKYGMVNILFDPKNRSTKNPKKQRQGLLKEFNARRTDFNTGGSNKTKIITAYRELALLALDYMEDQQRSTKELREYTQGKKIVDILQKNYYGWFRRVSRGVYEITTAGEQALSDYREVVAILKKEIMRE